MQALQKKEPTQTALTTSATASRADVAISAASEKKIKDCSAEEVLQTLKYVIALIGVSEKNMPEEIEIQVIIDFMFTEYGNRYSCSEIKLAFKWAIANHISVDRETWGMRFSCSYIARFVDAYQSYKFDLVKKSNSSQKLLPENTERKYLDPEKLEHYSKQFEAGLKKFDKKPVQAISITENVFIGKFESQVKKIENVAELNSIRKEIVDDMIICKESEVSQRRKQLAIVDERINYLMNNE